MCICNFQYIWNPNSIFGSWSSAEFTDSRLLAFFFSSAPLVFTRVMASGYSGILLRAGSSFSEDGPTVVQLFRDSRQLGEVLAYVASEDILPRSPIGLCQFPGLSSPETIQQASLNWLPVSIMRGSTCETLARVLMELLSSLTLLIPGIRLRMRSFQFSLHGAWDRLGPEASVRWASEIRQDFFWWLESELRELVISLEQVSSQLNLWSNSSDVSWRSAPRRGGSFQPLVSQGATQLHPSSRSLNNFLCVCAGRSAIPSLLPQFIMGRNTVLADFFSRLNPTQGSE